MERLTADEYAQWRQHPATQKVRQYWRDYRQRLMERWAKGNRMSEAQQAYCQILNDLDLMTFEDIKKFYNPEEEDAEQERDQPEGI